MARTNLGTYLFNIRLNSRARTISEYLQKLKQRVSLPISETYYRALENGDKVPTVDTVDKLAMSLGDDSARYEMFQSYLEDILPSDVFEKLVSRVRHAPLPESPKEALDQKEETLAAYRASLQNLLSIEQAATVYNADDEIVNFLDEHFELLPLVHFIYMKDGMIHEEELRNICNVNNIKQDLTTILKLLRDHKIAQVDKVNGRYHVRRFNWMFKLPRTPKGRKLRSRWFQSEIKRGLEHEIKQDPEQRSRGRIEFDKTFSHAMINCYRPGQLERIQDRAFDFIAELNASDATVEDLNAWPFFVAVMVSPRPEYSEGGGRPLWD